MPKLVVRWVIAPALTVALGSLGYVSSPPADATRADATPVAVPAATVLAPTSAPYFGSILDWTADSASAYCKRLGATPAYFGNSVQYPLRTTGMKSLTQFVQQASALGAAALLTVEPAKPLASLTSRDASALAQRLQVLHARYKTDFLVRFAPEMNGNWHTWGQQPSAYVHAFNLVAHAVHSATYRNTAQMMWAPAYGAGYPFARAVGKLTRSAERPTDQLDTNGDGVVDGRDDPYGPYYPGDASVDWVGLSLYDYGPSQRYGANVVAGARKYERMLAGTYGYQTPTGPGRDFVARFAVQGHHRMAVETAALYQRAASRTPSELAVKRAWWNQVLGAPAQRRYPQVKLVMWLEQRRGEAEVRGAKIDWRATSTRPVAAALHASLRTDRISLGPLLPLQIATSVAPLAQPGSGQAAAAEQAAAAGQVAAVEHGAGAYAAWKTWVAAALGIAVLLAAGFAFAVTTRRRRVRAA